METPARTFFLNTGIATFGRAVGVLTALVTTGLMTRLLGSAAFGDYSLIMAILGVVSVFADFGLGHLFVRELARAPEARRNTPEEVFTARLLLAAVFFGGTALAAVFLPYGLAVRLGLGLAAAGFFLMSVSQVLTGVFQKILAMHWPALAEVGGRAVQLALVVLVALASFGRGVAGSNGFFFLLMVGAFVAGAGTQFFVLWTRAARSVPLKFSFRFPRFKAALRETLPLGAALVFVSVYFRADTIILSLYHPGSAVGFYTLAYKVLENLIFIPATFVGLVFPRLSNLWVSDGAGFRSLLHQTFWRMGLAAPLAAVGTFLAAPWVVGLLGGTVFTPSIEALRILSGAVFFIFLAHVPGQTAVAIGAQHKVVWVYAAGAALNVALNLAFIPRYSFIAASWTTVITEAVVTAGLYWVVWREIKNNQSLISKP